ncbi:MAG: pitrilysin family protein [Bacteroidales bacterium]
MMEELNRKKEPGINLLKNINLPQPKSISLNNGIPVHLIDTGTQELIKIECLFKAGKWYEDKPLLARFTNKMLKRGSMNYDAKQIAEKMDFYGAHLESSPEMDIASVSVYSLNKHLPNILPVFSDVVLNPVFPDNELITYAQNQKQKFIVNSEKVKYLARIKFTELIFGKSNPYGRSFTNDDFTNINTRDLHQFHEKYYTSENFQIIVAGKLPENIIELLNNHFGNIERTENRIPFENNFAIDNVNGQFRHIKKDKTVQTALRIGKPIISRTHPDFQKLKILNTVLGGYFGSRLMTNIREDKGYTYGIGSAIVPLHHSGYFFIATEVGTNVTEKAIKEIHKEIEIIHNDLIPAKELDLVRNYLMGSFLRNVDGPFAIAESFRNILEYGLTMDYYSDFIETIHQTSAQELRDLAREYLNISSLYELKVGQ